MSHLLVTETNKTGGESDRVKKKKENAEQKKSSVQKTNVTFFFIFI